MRLERNDSAPKGKDIWERAQIVGTLLGSLVMPAVLALIAFEITGKLDNYIKQRRFEVETATAMSTALGRLMRTETEIEAQQFAVELVGFGQQSMVPLMYILQDANPVRADAARKGLELLSPSAHGEVCARLDLIMANKTGLYTVETHRKAVQVVRRIGCRGSFVSLEKYQKELAHDLAEFEKLKRQPAAFEDRVELTELLGLKREVDRALKTLSLSAK